MGSYRFDYYSAFLLVSTYASLNNASAWLLAPLTPPAPATGVDFLLAMARLLRCGNGEALVRGNVAPCGRFP